MVNLHVYKASRIPVYRPVSKKELLPPSVHVSLPQMAQVVMGAIQAMTLHRIRIHEEFQQPVFAGNALLM